MLLLDGIGFNSVIRHQVCSVKEQHNKINTLVLNVIVHSCSGMVLVVYLRVKAPPRKMQF